MSVENQASELDDVDRLVQQHRPRVLRFIFASVRDMDVADTLTQDCFWKAYRSRQAFRGDCSVQTWLMRIAVNLIRDHARRRRFLFWEKLRSAGDDTIHEWPDRGLYRKTGCRCASRSRRSGKPRGPCRRNSGRCFSSDSWKSSRSGRSRSPPA